MAQPGQFGPRGEDWLVRKVQELERTVQQLAAANPFKPMGIRPKDGGIIIEGYETVEGPLTVNGTAEFKGDTVIGGNAAITGTLSLPAGIIGNDALANPLTTQNYFSNANAFTVSPASVSVASLAFPLPEGFTKASIIVQGLVYLYNPHAVYDYIYSQVRITAPGAKPDWSNGRTSTNYINANGGSVTANPANMESFIDVPAGGLIKIELFINSQSLTMDNASNGAGLDVLCLFTR